MPLCRGWAGTSYICLPITVFTNGSGDTTYDYVLVLCYLGLSALGTLVWSLADRHRSNYGSLHQWLRLYVRVTLGGTTISYGAFKVIQTQFPAPSLSQLLEPYGDGSPMGLLWTFMGASHVYNVFAGLCEMCGGALVFVPRLTALGALMLMGVVSNVFLLNMSYDVPVKLYSFHLLLMAVFLTAPDLRRLLDFFVRNRAVEPATEVPLFKRRLLNHWALAFQLLLGAVFIVTTLHQSHQQAMRYGAAAPRPPLYGVWSVDEFVVDGTVRPPLLTDDLRWRRAIFEYPEALTTQSMSGERQFWRLKLDMAKRTLSLSKSSDQKWDGDFVLAQPQTDRLNLDGKLDGKPVQVKLERTDQKFLLTTRGFHWINEYPFGR